MNVPTDRNLCLRGRVDGTPVVFSIVGDLLTVGSAPGNDVVLTMPGVSRSHAVLDFTAGELRVRDTGSKNGVFVNGIRVSEAALDPGDWVAFGPAELRVELRDPGDIELGISFAAPEPKNEHERQDTTQSHAFRRVHRPGSWLEAVDAVADELLGSADGRLGVAVVRLAEGLGSPAAVYCRRSSETGSVEVITAWGDENGLTSREEVLRAFAMVADTGKSVPALLSGQVCGATPYLWSVAAQPGEDPRGLLVLGGFPFWEQAEAILRVVLRMLMHAEPLPIHLRLSSEEKDLPGLVFPAGYVVGRSTSMRHLHEEVRHLVVGDIPVLIVGETGVGKEYIAHTIHLSSRRAKGPFVAVNCAAIPADLLEAELFGIEKGVATGVTARPGKFALADGGILLLDEVSEMPAALQAKLLRALQEREIHPIGAQRPTPVNVRVIALTNSDLQKMIHEGRFRSDLYYRIAGYTLHVPPLRQRRDDIPLLVEHFVRLHTAEVGKAVRGVTAKTLRALVEAPWEGNVRELAHEVRRLVYLCQPGAAIESTLLSEHVLFPTLKIDTSALEQAGDLRIDAQLEALERRLVTIALSRALGNRSKAARLLGISRNGLAMKMERLGIC